MLEDSKYVFALSSRLNFCIDFSSIFVQPNYYIMSYKPTIAVSRMDLDGLSFIRIQIPPIRELINDLKVMFPDMKWNHEQKHWFLPYRSDAVSLMYNQFKKKYWVNYHSFYERPKKTIVPIQSPAKQLPQLDEFRLKLITQYKRYLQAKRYSESTIKTYSEALSVFFRYFIEKPIDEIDNQDVILFNNDYILKHNFSQTYQNQFVNAVKLFYNKIQNKKLNPDLIERPRTERKLPNVLSKEEVKAILDSLENLKHKTMLCLIYSCGLRRSELLHLELKDIDSKRNVVQIRQSKGKKDRIVPLSSKILELLRSYYLEYRPKRFLFEGQDPGTPYSEKSLESVMKQAREKSGVQKPVTLHWLRHCYATHLMESGTDLRVIQELLGHKSSKTTEIYTHVSTKSLQQIRSPFDDL